MSIFNSEDNFLIKLQIYYCVRMPVTFSEKLMSMNERDFPEWVVAFKDKVILILFHKTMSQNIYLSGPFQLFLGLNRRSRSPWSYIFMIQQGHACLTLASRPVNFFCHDSIIFLTGERESLRLQRNFDFNNISSQNVLLNKTQEYCKLFLYCFIIKCPWPLCLPFWYLLVYIF